MSDSSPDAKLLARIHRRFPTRTEQVRIGPVEFSFTRVADPDRVLDEVAMEEERRSRGISKSTGGKGPLHLPYWAELWESSLSVAEHLAEISGGNLAGQRVLDLGCGMALSGSAAAAMGANVLLADREAAALLFAQLNTLPWSDRIRTRSIDWQTAKLDEQFDLIIGADIIYERAQWDPLDTFWKLHLAPAGKILLGEPGRQTGDAFISYAKDRGWQIDQTERAHPTRPRPIRLFTLASQSAPTR